VKFRAPHQPRSASKNAQSADVIDGAAERSTATGNWCHTCSA
jgi:hypothetical protein